MNDELKYFLKCPVLLFYYSMAYTFTLYKDYSNVVLCFNDWLYLHTYMYCTISAICQCIICTYI